jgi:hypothetical protein
MSHHRREIPQSLVKSLSLTAANDALLGADSAAGMRKMRERIDQFFTDASNAPAPQSIETEDADADNNDGAQYEHEVQLSVLAGVLEVKKGPQLQRVDGVVLPTADNLERLDAEKMRDSHALLNMFAALRNPGEGTSTTTGPKRPRQKQRKVRVEGEGADAEEVEGSSGSDSECVIMNASSCSDTSDEEEKRLPARKWVTEMS